MSEQDKRVNERKKARPSWLRDPEWWQVAIGIVAIAVSIWIANYFYSKSQTKKQLEIWLYPNVSLVSVEDRVAKDIEVYYKGESVNNLSSLRFRIINTGNEPVASDDFERPLKFSVSPQATIISARVLESRPSNLNPKVTTQPPSDLVVEPTLFNKEEWADIELILVDDPTQTALPSLQVDARILGITEIPAKPFPEETGFPFSAILGNITGAVIAAGLILVVLTLSLAWRARERETQRIQLETLETIRATLAEQASLSKGLSRTSHPISADEEGLIINSAKYGAEGKTIDVTELLNSKISEGRLKMTASNPELGITRENDPCRGVVKKLRIVYYYAGRKHTKTYQENEGVSLPETQD